jgi:gentisate 1,2-dioxygenase
MQSSPLRIPWSGVQEALDVESGTHAVYHYGQNSSHLSNSISAQAERIAAGTGTDPNRETCSFIYHVKSGQGKSIIKPLGEKEKTFEWRENDTFAVPAWAEIQHLCSGDEAAYLFAINDRPMVESLGLFRRS